MAEAPYIVHVDYRGPRPPRGAREAARFTLASAKAVNVNVAEHYERPRTRPQQGGYGWPPMPEDE